MGARCLRGRPFVLCTAVALGALYIHGTDDEPRRAIELYDAGRYADAAAILADLDRQGRADGRALYRLHYCQRVAGDPAATATLDRARELLERETQNSREIEPWFYLVNAHASSNHAAEAQQAATAILARVESGEITPPTDATGMFQVGKLYADQQRGEPAAAWYEKALAATETPHGGALAPAYVVWASRFLGDRAWDAEDWDAAERHYAGVVAPGDAPTATVDRLAVTRARLGLWSQAATAWREIERRDPGNADRARYCSRVAEQAAEIGQLPGTAANGRLWTEISGEDLEQAMRDAVAVVASAREAAAGAELTPARRSELQAGLDTARATFVAAALEYGMRGLPLRETAFVGGFAPLVFHPDEWRVPEPEPPSAEEPPS